MTHYMDLSLIKLEGSKWKSDQIAEHIKASAKIYKRCGVKIRSAKIYTFDSKYTDLKETYSESGAQNTVSYVAKKTTHLKKPSLYFLDKIMTYDEPNAFAIAPISKKGREFKHVSTNFFIKSLVNTIWVSSDVINFPYDKGSGYNTIAHELGHVLLNEGHIDATWPREPTQEVEPLTVPSFNNGHVHTGPRTHPIIYNLMISGLRPQYRTGYLDHHQCQKIKSNDLVKAY